MNIIIHRGTHQIGGSCIELSTQNTRIIFDVGQELLSIDDIELQS
ncbi:MAG: ribonuclease [Clostridiales bacterium]|jgi:ribonuclease J|nr:ribonuclease [Clostridiales bacterium]